MTRTEKFILPLLAIAMVMLLGSCGSTKKIIYLQGADTLNLDSLSLVDLVAVIQYTYKLKIPVEDLRKIDTFNDLYDYLDSHVEK